MKLYLKFGRNSESLSQNRILMVNRAAYSPDLALCYLYYLFPKLKIRLKCTKFKSAEDRINRIT